LELGIDLESNAYFLDFSHEAKHEPVRLLSRMLATVRLVDDP